MIIYSKEKLIEMSFIDTPTLSKVSITLNNKTFGFSFISFHVVTLGDYIGPKKIIEKSLLSDK